MDRQENSCGMLLQFFILPRRSNCEKYKNLCPTVSRKSFTLSFVPVKCRTTQFLRNPEISHAESRISLTPRLPDRLSIPITYRAPRVAHHSNGSLVVEGPIS